MNEHLIKIFASRLDKQVRVDAVRVEADLKEVEEAQIGGNIAGLVVARHLAKHLVVVVRPHEITRRYQIHAPRERRHIKQRLPNRFAKFVRVGHFQATRHRHADALNSIAQERQEHGNQNHIANICTRESICRRIIPIFIIRPILINNQEKNTF